MIYVYIKGDVVYGENKFGWNIKCFCNIGLFEF